MVVIEGRLQILLDEGIDASWFDDCSHDDLRAYLGNLKAHRCRLDTVEANRKAKRAELFEQWPQITAALAEGHISAGHADLLTGIPQKYQPQLTRDLPALLTQATEQTVDEFKDTVRQWKDDAAPENGEDPHQRRKDSRSCQIRKEADGMVRLNTRLDPETGAKVRNAVTEIAQDLLRQDQQQDHLETRNYEQRLADAAGILTDRATGTDPNRPSHQRAHSRSRHLLVRPSSCT